MFDHMIVKAVVDGKTEWLDGTQQGNSYLDNQVLPFRWALPLNSEGLALEEIVPRDTGFPMLVGTVDIDATSGVNEDAKVTARNIVRGDEAFAIQSQLTTLSTEDADRAMKTYWRQQLDWAVADKVAWSYNERRRAVTLELNGRGNPGWTGDSSEGHSLTILGAGFFAPDPLRRPADQDQLASWSNEFPRFRCWATTIRLPKASDNLSWSLYADPMNQRLGGTEYWRASGFSGNIVRTVMSRRNIMTEVPPAEAATANRAIPKFNNNMSNVAEVKLADVLPASLQLPFGDAVDWLNAPTPCTAK